MSVNPKSKMTEPLPVSDKMPGFDITCVIGRVELSLGGTVSPHEAAFALIGRHDRDGHFTFPDSHGGTIHVTVETEEPLIEVEAESW